jgi:hypothetical protein
MPVQPPGVQPRRHRRAAPRWPKLEQSTQAGFDCEAAWRAVEPEDLLTLI